MPVSEISTFTRAAAYPCGRSRDADQRGGFRCFGVMRRMLSDIAIAFAGRKMTLTSEQENE
jgi:hypothetical protein